MNETNFDFGMVGLGVMGRNLALNISEHGYATIGLDLDPLKAAALEKEATAGTNVKATTDTAVFVQSLRKPRALMLLVPAGAPVDAAIASLLPYLEPGDVVIDGGNSYFADTDRRGGALRSKGIHFFGMGISGGEQGARTGPSLMPGGDKDAYERLRPIFEAVAAKAAGEPCVAYLGAGAAGNYVKMVHNGIEYGIMQLIAEMYDLLKRGAGMDDDALQHLFEKWNNTELQSYLVEITADILKHRDNVTGQPMVGVISDRARSKGTGKWTAQNAMDLRVAVPTIDMAVGMRDLSKYKEERTAAAKALPNAMRPVAVTPELLEAARHALYFAIIATYAQGMAQLRMASDAYGYGLQLAQVARTWRGGCIIRSACLGDIRMAYEANPLLPNLLLDPAIGADLLVRQPGMRAMIKLAIDQGIAVPALMASLAYFDAYRTETLPTNLIQAQRDYFGAHTYERVDQEGLFHTQWQ